MTPLILGVKAAAHHSFMPANTALRCRSNAEILRRLKIVEIQGDVLMRVGAPSEECARVIDQDVDTLLLGQRFEPLCVSSRRGV
jgi:hypothetical protein